MRIYEHTPQKNGFLFKPYGIILAISFHSLPLLKYNAHRSFQLTHNMIINTAKLIIQL